MNSSLTKGALSLAVAIAASLAPAVSHSAVTCGVYTVDPGSATSYSCQSFGSGPNGSNTSTGGPVTSIITHNGASTLDSFGGVVLNDVSDLESWGGSSVGTFSGATLTPSLSYVVLLWDTPLSGGNQPWMVLSALGSDLLASVTITESTGTGTFKYRIYEGVQNPDNPVPVPASLALVALGLAAVGVSKKRAS